MGRDDLAVFGPLTYKRTEDEIEVYAGNVYTGSLELDDETWRRLRSPEQIDTIWIESGVSHVDNRGYCRVQVGDKIGQLDPATVREMATQWLEVAAQAEMDAALWRFFRDANMDEQEAVRALAAVRQLREET